jgi:hypothetical protein
MLGLGYSIGTGPQGITAEVIVVRSFDELKARRSEVLFIKACILYMMRNYSKIFKLWLADIT